MEAQDIPKECLQNSQFSMVLKATLETEIKRKREKLREKSSNRKVKFIRFHDDYLLDVQDQIEAVKKSVEHKYNERKVMKQLLEIEKEKLTILEPTLKVLSASYEEKKNELQLMEEDLDSDSLRMKDEQRKHNEIVENYKKTWESYQKEYEQLDLAIKRKNAKVRVEKAKVQLMISEFKKNELITMLEQREAISDMRLRALIIEMSQLVLNRWKQQSYQDELKEDIVKLNKQYEEICEKHNKIKQEIEEEAKAKALARQLMPAPRIDNSVLRSVYSATPRSTETRIRRQISMGPDNISLCSSILEQLYSGNERVFDKIHDDEEKEKEKEDVESLKQFSCCECSQNSNVDEEGSQNSQHESNINTLENVCRQLSIDEELTCDENNDKIEDANNTEVQQITCKAIIETPRLPESQQAYLGPVSHLKKKSIINTDSIDIVSEEPEKKRSKLAGSFQENVLTQSNLVGVKDKTQNLVNKILPQIKKIETINEPIKILTKPPMAEVPPTPNLFPNRHYAPSCASSEDRLSIMGDGNYEIDTNWQNFSPPHRVDSSMSFMSNASMFKNMIHDTPAMPIHPSEVMSNHPVTKESDPVLSTSQPNNSAANFFSCFTNVKPSTQNFF